MWSLTGIVIIYQASTRMCIRRTYKSLLLQQHTISGYMLTTYIHTLQHSSPPSISS